MSRVGSYDEEANRTNDSFEGQGKHISVLHLRWEANHKYGEHTLNKWEAEEEDMTKWG